MKKMNKKGFTLIELIIVIVILGVLAGVGVPKMISSIRDSKASTAASNIELIKKQACMLFATSDDKSEKISESDILDELNKSKDQMNIEAIDVEQSSQNDTDADSPDNTNTIDVTITFNENNCGFTKPDLEEHIDRLGGSLTDPDDTGEFDYEIFGIN